MRTMLCAGLVFATGAALAQGADGTWTGWVRCAAVQNVTVVGAIPFSMTVEGGRARYEREIRTSDGRPTGNYERGTGTVAADGTVSLVGGAQGRGESRGAQWTYSANYGGRISGRTLNMQGTQSWQVPGTANAMRSCTLTLTRQ